MASNICHFPSIKITKNHMDEPFVFPQFFVDQLDAASKSHGLIINSFSQVEIKFLEYWNKECKPKAWCVGPLCMAEPLPTNSYCQEKKPWMEWLDTKKESSVLYIAFGSQAELSMEQIEEIKIGLDKSEVNFLWVLRPDSEVDEGFEDRVIGRGIVVREWVDQRKILGHESVKGFVSHCGWNSVMESICAKVPILAWPMGADQPLSAKIVVEEYKVGLMMETCNGSVRGFVNWEGLERIVSELMEGEMGKIVRKRIAEVGDLAVKAMEEGGSSSKKINELMHHTHVQRYTHFIYVND